MKKKAKNECGAGLVEYALLIALISVISYAAIQQFGYSVGDNLSTSKLAIEGAGQDAGTCTFNPISGKCE